MTATSLHNRTAQFWAAANYIRRSAPNAPLRGQAFRILRRIALQTTGPLKQRALELTKGTTDEPTCYDG